MSTPAPVSPAQLRERLAHVVFIGGGTDAGKTTLARTLAERRGWQLYHYDRHDQAHIERLAMTNPAYRAFLEASLDERWVLPTPAELHRRALQAAADRFPLVITDLLALPAAPPVLAEGFGLLPDLLAPLLAHPRQAVWLLPAPAFKAGSMARRGKPSFAAQVSDPQRARANLLERDRLWCETIRTQAARLGLAVIELDGSLPPEALADRIEAYLLGAGNGVESRRG